MDDGLGGGEEEIVKKLIGDESFGPGPLEETGGVLTGHSTAASLSPSMPKYTGTVAKIMSLGGFKIKYMIRNGEKRPELLELYGGSVLGLPWDASLDVICLSMNVNLSNKFKLVLQKMVEAKLDWDERLEGELEKEAKSALMEMVTTSTVSFPRCVLGDQYKEQGWMLVGFLDGGKPASACCLYARTPLKEEGPEGQTHLVGLLAGKARVTPTSSTHGQRGYQHLGWK